MKLVRISKAGPDQSEVHVLGNGKRLKKLRRPRYKDAIRRTK